MTIYHDLETQRQIDRACAAQSSEMLPKMPTPPEVKAAQKEALRKRVEKYFQ